MGKVKRSKKPQLVTKIYVTRSWLITVEVTEGGDYIMREAVQSLPYISGESGNRISDQGRYRWTRKELESSINVVPKDPDEVRRWAK